MRLRVWGLAGLLLVFLCPTSLVYSQNNSAAKAYDLYASGDYAGAVREGTAAGGGPGFSIAARAALAEEDLHETPCLDCLKQAETLSRTAIAAAPASPEAYVYLALALGFEARIVGILRARLNNYPQDAKQALDRALALAPDDAWAWAGLGAWNIEIVRSGGAFLGRFVYGASLAAGVAHFQKAIGLEPENPVLHFQYALSLASYDLDAKKMEIEAALGAAARIKSGTAYEIAIRDRSVRLLGLLHEGKIPGFVALVRNYQGYP